MIYWWSFTTLRGKLQPQPWWPRLLAIQCNRQFNTRFYYIIHETYKLPVIFTWKEYLLRSKISRLQPSSQWHIQGYCLRLSSDGRWLLHLPKAIDHKHLESVYFLKKAFGCSRQDDLIIHHTCEACLYFFSIRDINIGPHCSSPRNKPNCQPPSFFLELVIASQIQELFTSN